ncbi:anti-sigma factor [Paenibacillus wynnii]|uniref:anti-sigma factor n=1 Tax=Paenibacillus wynnii TaxID=268407 RepID=UPI0027929120|nr:zf-HC2 domain-containing protein [Paenibacillus wynnii]MDQ0195116.1 anti-sigma factor RsiW [Paenibacillus wynnii]
MNCEQIKEWMPHYLDGLLSLERERSIRLHIDTCPACVQSLEVARDMAALWREMEGNMGLQVDLDIPDLTGAVMAKIELIEAERIQRVPVPTTSRRRYTPRTSWMHYSVAACLTFLLFQFGVFEGLAYQITEINGHMSNSVTALFGPQANPPINK